MPYYLHCSNSTDIEAYKLFKHFLLSGRLLETPRKLKDQYKNYKPEMCFVMKDSNYLITHRFQLGFVFWQGFVIAFVSEFVPRLYYTLVEGHDSLEGFVNSTMSCFVVTDFPEDERPNGTDANVLFRNDSCGLDLPTCR